MDVSLLLARLIGPLFVVVGIGVLLNRAHYTAMMASFLKNSELYYFSGALALIVGEAIVLYHNLWVADWRVVITLIGWISLLKGAVRIVFPAAGLKIAGSLSESTAYLNIAAIFLVLVGAWLAYQGFGPSAGP